jgi:membrane protease YdiL (CAAX protease family)
MTTLRAFAGGDAPAMGSSLGRRWGGAVAIGAALAGIVGLRWLASVEGFDPLAIGALFGLALVALWRVARPAGQTIAARRVAIAAAAGLAFGLVIVALAVVGAWIGGAPIVGGLARPAAPFLPWAAITVLVAAGEEGLLRGALFDRVRAAGGTLPAIAITTIAFGLLHVPLYGWHVVPLDLAVGLGFAGLRLSTRTVLAPVIAHAVADLATWWL